MLIMEFLGSMRPEHDGTTRVAFRMRTGFKQSGARHLYVSPIVATSDNEDMRKVFSMPVPFSTGYRLSLCRTSAIRTLLREQKPDLIHIHSPCTLGFAAVKAARSLGIPVVATFHTHFPSYLKYYKVGFLVPLAWKYFRSLYNLCETVIVPSQAMLEVLNAQGFKNLVCIPHGVDTQKFSPALRSKSWRENLGCEGKIVVLFAGRLVWEKNIGILPRILALVTHKEQIEVVIAGDGPARAKLQTMMPKARFLGHLSAEDLAVAYASSDVFVMPSLTETFGNVTVEAMASGLVPICAAAGGACDLIQSGKNGFLVAPNNAQDCAQAIDKVVENSALRNTLMQEALASAPRYCWEETIKKYQYIYRTVMNTPLDIGTELNVQKA